MSPTNKLKFKVKQTVLKQKSNTMFRIFVALTINFKF